MLRKYDSGALKRKHKKEEEKFNKKLPKLTEYFSPSQSNADEHEEHAEEANKLSVHEEAAIQSNSSCLTHNQNTYMSTQLDVYDANETNSKNGNNNNNNQENTGISENNVKIADYSAGDICGNDILNNNSQTDASNTRDTIVVLENSLKTGILMNYLEIFSCNS